MGSDQGEIKFILCRKIKAVTDEGPEEIDGGKSLDSKEGRFFNGKGSFI
jgi:hypothetical protein